MDARLQTNKVFELLSDSDKRITVMQGGSRSGKTYNILIWIQSQKQVIRFKIPHNICTADKKGIGP